MIGNPLSALRNLVTQDSRTVGALDQTINRALGPLAGMFGQQEDEISAQPLGTFNPMQPTAAPQPLGAFDPSQAAGMFMPAGGPEFSGVAAAGPGWTAVTTPEGGAQRREGARAWRNNNPGNIEFGDFARSQGAVGSDGRFAVFPTYEAGRSAKEALLFESPAYQGRTIEGAINRYAPPTENRTTNYVAEVARTLGVPADTPLADLSPDQRSMMLDAMERVEGFQPGTTTDVELDDLYQSVGGALGVTPSSSGSLTARERAGVEADLGAILNEVYDPESAVDAERRHGVADLLTGLGVGFGQMSRGDRVDLSEVRQAAERRQQQNIQLRMERSRRAAGASYAMELGDEGLARAIAAGAADVNTLLSKRQQDIVNRRADEALVREAANAGYLADALEGVVPDSMIAAIREGADPTTVLRANELSRAAAAATKTQERIDNQIAFAQTMIERATAAPDQLDPITMRALELATLDNFGKILAGGSMFDYMSEARLQTATGSESGFTLSPGQTRFDAQGNPIAEVGAAPAGDPGQVMLAQQVLTNPASTPEQIAAANVVVETGGATTLPQAVQALTAGAPDADTTVRTQRVATLAEGFTESGVPPEQADALARGIVDGRYETVQDPQTGEVTVYDKVAMMTGQDRASAQVFPPPPGPSDYDPPSILNADLDYTSAFGLEGVALNALNNVGEALGLGLVDSSNREAVQTIRRLATAGRIAAAVEVGGRPSAYLLEMYQDLETNPAQLFTGPQTALIRLENQRAATVRELQQLDAMLVPGSGISAADRSGASARRIALLPLLSDLDTIIGGMGRTAQATDAPQDTAPIPDVARRNPALVTMAEGRGLSVEEVWQYLSPEAKQRLSEGQ
jgi:hypothetical protein